MRPWPDWELKTNPPEFKTKNYIITIYTQYRMMVETFAKTKQVSFISVIGILINFKYIEKKFYINEIQAITML